MDTPATPVDALPRYTLIRDLPAPDRPRERLRDAGAGALSVAELLAILLRTGSAKESALAQATRLLRDVGGLEEMRSAPFAELCAQAGIGEAKAAQIKAALELGFRLQKLAGDDKGLKIVRTPEDVADLLLAEMSLLQQEVIRVILLDTRSHLRGVIDVYQGSVHTAHVRVSELLRDAIRANATAIVLVHNHPSGDPAPSSADVNMTKQLCEAGSLLDIEIHDHIIIGAGRYVSMRALRMGFPG